MFDKVEFKLLNVRTYEIHKTEFIHCNLHLLNLFNMTGGGVSLSLSVAPIHAGRALPRNVPMPKAMPDISSGWSGSPPLQTYRNSWLVRSDRSGDRGLRRRAKRGATVYSRFPTWDSGRFNRESGQFKSQISRWSPEAFNTVWHFCVEIETLVSFDLHMTVKLTFSDCEIHVFW